MRALTDILELADPDTAIIDAVLAHRHVRAVVREIGPAWAATRPSAVSLSGAAVVRPRFGRQTGAAQADRPDLDMRRPSAA